MKVQTWTRREAIGPKVIDFCGGQLALASFVSPDKETCNEDAIAAIELGPEHGVVIVADGLGGHQAGDQAASEIVNSIAGALRKTTAGQSITGTLVEAVGRANQRIMNWGLGAGSTVVVAEILDRSVQMIHAGDSCGLICSNRARVKFQTVAHSPVALAVELGVLSEAEAIAHDERNVVSNFVGFSDMKIEVGPEIQLASRDTVLLATDGLFDNATIEEIVQAIRAGQLESQFEKLITTIREQMQRACEETESNIESSLGKPDDLTVACFRLHSQKKRNELAT